MKSELFQSMPIIDGNQLSAEDIIVTPSNVISVENSKELAVEDVVASRVKKKRPQKIFKKFICFFSVVVRPILTFVPNFINALAYYKRATVTVK